MRNIRRYEGAMSIKTINNKCPYCGAKLKVNFKRVIAYDVIVITADEYRNNKGKKQLHALIDVKVKLMGISMKHRFKETPKEKIEALCK